MPFCPIHRRVSAIDQCVWVIAIFRVITYPDARCQLQNLIPDRMWHSKRLDNFLADTQYIGMADSASQQDNELVPTVSSNRIILAYRATQSLCSFLEHFIADTVPQGVVDQFEVI